MVSTVWLAVCGRELVLCGKLSWHPSRTDFMEAELILDDLIGRTILICRELATSPVCQYHLSNLLKLLVSGGG
jgi:hypothetical protein